MSAATPAFCGSPLERDDALRCNPARLAEARAGDALLLRLDGLAPVVGDDDRLAWAAIAEAGDDAEVVFLGLLQGRAAFAAVPPQGDSGPAYAHRPAWDLIARLPAADLAL